MVARQTKLLAFSQLANPTSNTTIDEIELGVDKYRHYITPQAAHEIYLVAYSRLKTDRERKIFWLGAHISKLMEGSPAVP